MFRTVKFSISNLIAAVIILTLASCGGGGGGDDSDPDYSAQKSGSISGQVSLGSPAIEGIVTAYSWQGGAKGSQIGSSAIGTSGDYSIQVSASSQKVLLEVTAAKYKEVTSSANVKFKNDHFLSAVVDYAAKQNKIAQITSFSTLAHALAAYKITTGVSAENAISESNKLFSSLLDLDVVNVKPARIYSEDDVYAGVSDEAKYGFFLSAISSWMKDISETNKSGEHDFYNSIHAVMAMYRDIRDDGLWDGQIISAASGESVSTSLGKVSLDSQVYRQKIAQHALKLINSDTNKSTLVAGDLFASINQFSQSTDPFFATLEPLALDEEGPQVAAAEGMDKYLSGEAEYKCTVSDVAGIKDIIVKLDGDTLESFEFEGEELNITVDTTLYEDGVYALEVTAVDHLDNETIEELDFYINNDSSVITVTTSDYANQTPFNISGTYFESGPKVKAISVAGVTATLDKTEKTWSAQVPLSIGKNDYEVIFTDELDEEEKFDFSVYLDRNAPEIDLSNGHSEAYFFVSGEVIKDQLQDDNSDNLLYFDKDTHALNGVAQTLEALDSANIAYFSFIANDPADHTVYTEVEDLDVSMIYKIGSKQVGDEIELTPLGGNESWFVIPLAEETLDNDWDQSTENQLHEIVVTVKDQAENSVSKTFSFKAKFDAPSLTINSLNIDSTVNIYSWAQGTKGSLLETCTTDSNGSCNVRIYNESQPMLIEILDGKYRELATGTLVPLSEEDILQAVFNYQQVDTKVTVTPVTHMAAALAANQIADGIEVSIAIQDANTIISDLYSIDILNDIPFDISNISNAVDEVDNNLEYSLLLAGISSWTNDYALDNGYQNQYEFHSVLFAQLAAEDIIDDGLLNGGVSFGDTELNQSVYRNEIANGMIDAINGIRNNTTRTISDVLDYIKLIAEDTNLIYDNAPVQPLDNQAPVVEASNFDNLDYFSGIASFVFDVDDKIGIKQITASIDNIPVIVGGTDSQPVINVDTTGFVYGDHQIQLTSTDMLDNTSIETFDIKFDNSALNVNTFNIGSTATAYTWVNGIQGDKLDSCLTDSTGGCTLNPMADEQPIIVVLTGGNYKEISTGTIVAMGAQTLTTVYNYQGTDSTITVNPITKIIEGYATKLIADGAAADVAINSAYSDFESLYGFDTLTTIPFDISDNSFATSEVTGAEKYSLLLAGISQWAYDIAQSNGVNQSTYNSLLYALRVSEDINTDGKLNGGVSFGSKALSQSVYKNEIADSILSILNNIQRNKTTLETADMITFLEAVAESTHTLYDGHAVAEFDGEDPVVVLKNFADGDTVSGLVNLSFDITDKTGLATLKFSVDVEQPVDGNISTSLFSIDTTAYANGEHTIKAEATDNAGNTATAHFVLNFTN
ncbi:MAG: hypothetical protein D6B28_00240 [Gammaproteobacteria bacterium]|nr:MAG: hypothetical protein D6B28_00240 [Gammaproteobacteria bacterium]